LERHHDVLAVTLAGHAGGPPIEGEIGDALLADAVERAMDEAGFEIAQIAGNSLGGYVALQLASRGRAETVVALAPAGGWAQGDESYMDLLRFQSTMQHLARTAAPHAEAVLASPEGRRRATQYIATSFEHIPAELLAHQMRGAAGCEAASALIDHAIREGWSLDAEKITCPVRIVWGTDDRLLPWPVAAARFRTDWLPHADWIELEGVGHCPQLDIPLETAQLILGFTATVAHVEDDAIRLLVTRLARPHPAGGTVIERAAIVAEGADFEAVMTWILARGGKPEAAVETSARHGLHGSRLHAGGGSAPRAPSRFVLPAGAFD
jgi:pimeloyl-ACP methyl ester carboxylesterase